MNDTLNNLCLNIEAQEIRCVEKWWSELTEENRKQVVKLFEEQSEIEFISLQKVMKKRKLKSKKQFVIIGQFENAEEFESDFEWHKDFYEYLVANPESLILIKQFHTPKFHVCTQHEKARKVLEKGIVPHNFDCPLKDDNCLMRKILLERPGGSLRFRALSVAE